MKQLFHKNARPLHSPFNSSFSSLYSSSSASFSPFTNFSSSFLSSFFFSLRLIMSLNNVSFTYSFSCYSFPSSLDLFTPSLISPLRSFPFLRSLLFFLLLSVFCSGLFICLFLLIHHFPPTRNLRLPLPPSLHLLLAPSPISLPLLGIYLPPLIFPSFPNLCIPLL